MKRRNFLMAAAGAGLATGLFPRMAYAQTRWDLTAEYNENAYQTRIDRLFLEKLSELTNGEFAITMHSGGTLGYLSADNFDAVGDGLVQMATTASGALSGINPIFGVGSLPFLAVSGDESKRLLETATPYFSRVFESNNQIMLFANPDLATGIWAKDVISDVAQLQNLKVRTYDANGTLTFQAAGAAPSQLPFADLIPQLSTGGVDAALGSAEAGILGGIWDFVPYFTALGYAAPFHIRHVNADEFNALPQDMQDAFMEASAWAAIYLG